MKNTALTASVIIALLMTAPAQAGLFVSGRPSLSEPPRVFAAEDIPSRYDLRDEGRVTPIRSQLPWTTCWAHAAIAAVESNYLTNHTDADSESLDFSEMSLVWFARINQDKSRSFSMYDRNNAMLVRMGSYGMALQEGAYPNIALALLASAQCINDESDFPYLDSNYFTQFGFTTTNPPTNAEAESAGMIPLNTSTPSRIIYNGRTVTPRNNLRMTDAYFGATVAVPSGYANQRRDYAEQGRVNREALKALIMRYGAAMIGYYSGENTRTNLNASTHGYNITDTTKWKANHEITVIGWDDDYSRDNFVNKPESNGAWLARNSWGSFAGSDGGYEWISYELLMGDGIVCAVEDKPDNLHVYEHDPLGWCNTYVTEDRSDMLAANVFMTDSDNETLESVSFYTANHNTRVLVRVYDLGASFAGTDPTAGSMLYSTEQVINYAGYHTLKTDRVSLTKDNYFSVVITFTSTNGGYGSVPVEVAIKRYSDNAAVYDRESFFSEDGGATWVDGTDIVDESNNDAPYHVNACIKAFTIAPNFTTKPQRTRTIAGLPIETFTPAQTTSIGSNIPTTTTKTASINLNSGGNVNVSLYLVDKSRTYEPVSISDEEELDEQGYPKGRTGPVQWVNVPVYKAGYKPDFFWNDEGINYAVYGPFNATTNAGGSITVNVDELTYQNGSRPRLPESYYTIYSELSTGATNEVGVVLFAANSDDNSSGNSPAQNSGGGGGGGGCNAGVSMLCVIAATYIILKR